jgi:hypothetical protein
MNKTDKAISEFAKALRECNRMPVMAGEEIIRIKRITGKDGIERELIFVKQLANKPPAPGELGGPGCAFHIRYGKTHLGLFAQLRRGYGIKRGIVTDGKTYRYDV